MNEPQGEEGEEVCEEEMDRQIRIRFTDKVKPITRWCGRVIKCSEFPVVVWVVWVLNGANIVLRNLSLCCYKKEQNQRTRTLTGMRTTRARREHVPKKRKDILKKLRS